MKIGKYTIDTIETGTFGLDGGAMFGIIPKPLWEKNNPADESNRVTLSARCLLLQSPDRRILVDTGIGDKWDEKSRSIYRIDQYSATLTDSLADKGIKPGDVTDVVLTHLHFDHAGGATVLENGKTVPAFPNARYYVQKKNFDWALKPSDRDRGSYIKSNFIALAEEGVLNFTEGNCSFDDEIEFYVVNGHTFSQQLLKISDSSQILFYCGDLFPFSSHVHLPYIMGYDLQPLVTLEEKKKVLALAANEEWKLIYEHDPYSVCTTVAESEKGIKVKERFDTI